MKLISTHEQLYTQRTVSAEVKGETQEPPGQTTDRSPVRPETVERVKEQHEAAFGSEQLRIDAAETGLDSFKMLADPGQDFAES